jgi:hypothetical protein
MADAGAPKSEGPSAGWFAGVRWGAIQVWFHRLLGLGWLALGLQAWAVMIGVPALASRAFESRGLTAQAVTIYFAVVDVMAGVGLWLLAPWGGVVWLIACVSRIVLALVFPLVAGLGAMGLAMLGVCLAAFLAVSWAAARQAAR